MTSMSIRALPGIFITLAALAWVGPASAAIIAEHVGANDPDTEAVSATNTATWDPHSIAASEVGAITGSPDSWRIDSTGYAFYRHSPTAAGHDALDANGWKLSVNVRIPNADEDLDFAPYVEYSTNSANSSNGRYYLLIGSNGDGEQIVSANGPNNDTTPDYTVSGSTISDFVLYELVWTPGATPGTGTADLFVTFNNTTTEVRSDILHDGGSYDRIQFGNAASTGAGEAYYNLVRLETVPEPASLALLGIGSVLVLGRRRRSPTRA